MSRNIELYALEISPLNSTTLCNYLTLNLNFTYKSQNLNSGLVVYFTRCSSGLVWKNPLLEKRDLRKDTEKASLLEKRDLRKDTEKPTVRKA